MKTEVKKNLITEFTTGIPGWAKGIVWAGVIIGGGYVIYKIVKAGGSVTNILKKDQQKKDVNELEQIFKPTYQDGQYKGFADAIYSARAGSNIFGTVEDTIIKNMTMMKNDLDVAKLIVAFGERRLSFSTMVSGLHGYLSDEMDVDELEPINKNYATKGITYRF